MSFFGVKALFVPALITAMGMLEGGVTGGYLGLLAGFFLDISYLENSILFTVLFTGIGFISGSLSEYYINKKFFSYMFLAAAALLATAFCQGIRAVVFHGAGFHSIVSVAIAQTIWSLPFSIPTYFICKAVAERPETSED